jgi:prepilin-type N-terminal cleavage/methylation domain-containing protein
MKNTQRARGFTLIELMVVVAIIGLLSSIVLASLNQSRNKGTNGHIQTDIHQYMNALELYYTKNNGVYPTPAAGTGTFVCLGSYPGGSCWGGVQGNDLGLVTALAPYIQNPPGQTVAIGANTFTGYIYQLKANGQYEIKWFLYGANQKCGYYSGVAGNNGQQDYNNLGLATLCDVLVGP